MKIEETEEKFFANKGFGQTMGFGNKPAIIVIDAQNAFTDENLPLGSSQDAVISVINKIITEARRLHVPIFLTKVIYNDSDFIDVGWFKKTKDLTALKAGANGSEIDSRIKVEKGDSIVTKKYASAFFGTNLISQLNTLRIDTPIFMGFSTSGCVRASVVDAMQYGLTPIVCGEAVGDRSENAHKQSLFDMQAKYADVLSYDKIISYFEKLSIK